MRSYIVAPAADMEMHCMQTRSGVLNLDDNVNHSIHFREGRCAGQTATHRFQRWRQLRLCQWVPQ